VGCAHHLYAQSQEFDYPIGILRGIWARPKGEACVT
jgi:hypothetical protein